MASAPGGKWMEFRSEDKMTGAKKVRFELLANNYFRQDPDYKPRVEMVCTNGKYQYADFNMAGGWDGRIIPAFGASPRWKSWSASMAAMTTRDGTGFAGRFLAMDKGHGSRRDWRPGVQSGSENEKLVRRSPSFAWRF